MHRFFVSPDQIIGDQVVIQGAEVRHLNLVLRLRPGQEIEVVDGCGYEYSVRLTYVSSEKAEGDILLRKISGNEPPVEVILYQGLSKGDKLELVIQKGVELGVKQIIPLITERTVVQWERSSPQRLDRWKRVAMEAAKQSRRGCIPSVEEPVALTHCLELWPTGLLGLFLWEEERSRGFREILRQAGNPRRVALLVGPEGGFTANEASLAAGRGLIPVSLGPRILRTETAGIVALALTLYELGDLGGAAGG
ncbi:MAG: 16S rRNA (uracil(1498)-N(3))-methyltransferase [Bacillota bacterium]